MAVVSLQEKLQTRFMIDSIYPLMTKVIKEIVDRGDIVDIAHVNFTPKCMKEFLLLLSTLEPNTIVDTFSEVRNEILEENFRRVQEAKNTTIVDMKSIYNKPRDKQGIITLINSFEKDKVYDLISQDTLSFDIPFVVFLQLLRPSISVTLGAYGDKFYKYVSDVLYSKNREKVIKSTNNFILFTRGRGELQFSTREVVITEKDPNKEFDLYPIGKVSWTKLLDNLDDVYLIPAEFGRLKVCSDPKYVDVYSGLKARCVEDIERYAKVHWKSLKSLLV